MQPPASESWLGFFYAPINGKLAQISSDGDAFTMILYDKPSHHNVVATTQPRERYA